MTKTEKKDKKEILAQIVSLLKEHHLVKEIFDKYDVDISYFDKIPISFKDLDVSAKAKNGHIYINSSFLEDGNILDDIHYIVHEVTHILQQITGSVTTKNEVKNKHYLDDPSEIEAFKNQIEFIDSYKNEDEADKYVDDLLDFHDFKGESRKRKRKQLRGE